MIDIEKQVNYWRNGSFEAFETAKILIELNGIGFCIVCFSVI